MEKLACKTCGHLILPTTAKKNDGMCALCAKGMITEQCQVCHKVVYGVSTIHNGTRMCLSCNQDHSLKRSLQWRELCSDTLTYIATDSIKIKLFPAYTEVFVTEQCLGFYYPLCSLQFQWKGDQTTETVHIVSHNGLWFAEEGEPNNPYESFSMFDRVGDKYKLTGSLTNFSGWKYVQALYKFMEREFKHLSQTHESKQAFIEAVLASYPHKLGDFDKEYYIETYYEYTMRKQACVEKGFLPYDSIDKAVFSLFNEEHFIAIGEEIIDYREAGGVDRPLGVCWSESFFGDGNHIFAFLDENKDKVYLVNQYS